VKRAEGTVAIISPSDVGSYPSGARLRVGGRVRSTTEREWILADAFVSIRVRLSAAEGAAPGDLVVVDGVRGRRGLSRATLVARRACPAQPPDGEHARLFDQGVGQRLLARVAAVRTVREYFDGHGFVEIETPIRVPCPGLDSHVDAIAADGGYLITSPEHHMKRLLVGGTPRLYQLARTSRAGELGPKHEPEFTMLEWYRAFSDVSAVMADTENLVIRVAQAVNRRAEVRLGDDLYTLATPFARLTVREAFHEFAAVSDVADLAETDEDRYFQLFVDTVEPGLARSPHPLFLTEFPLSQGALARPTPHDPSVVERFELFIGGVELCNGYGELTDPVEQRRRFELVRARRRSAGAPVYPVDARFMAALEEGLPPTGGNALGFDRLLSLVLGVESVADVMPFPSSRL
jgi:lysyl-tRNA synthetase class 2